MMRIGHAYANGNSCGHACHCDYCGKLMGYEEYRNGEYYCDFDGWEFCPYCGAPLYEE